MGGEPAAVSSSRSDASGAAGPHPPPVPVLMVGPPPGLLGGMASVAGQMLTLDLEGRYRIELFPLTFSAGAGELPLGRAARHLGHLFHLAGAVRRSGAALVHVHACSGFSFYRAAADMIVSQVLGCRTVLHVHGAAFDHFFAESGVLSRRLIAACLGRAERVVALSEAWRRALQAMSPAARISVIENAVEAPAVLPVRGHHGPCRFLLLARMDRWKGVDDLLDAAAELRVRGCPFELVLAGPAGTAGDKDELAAKIRARNLDPVGRYVGPVRGQEKVDLLRWADVYVQPSHHEGMPISLLEALAFGLPVVATRVGAVPELMVDGVHGRLVPPHRQDLLAKAMAELAERPAVRPAMSEAAARLAEARFGLRRFQGDLLALYDGLTAPSRPGRPFLARAPAPFPKPA